MTATAIDNSIQRTTRHDRRSILISSGRFYRKRSRLCPASQTLWLRGAALTEVVRTVGDAVRRGDLCRGFGLAELLVRLLEGLQFLVGAIEKRDVLARDEEYLPNGHGSRGRDPLAGLEHVAKFRFVHVPVGLDADDEHRGDGPLDVVEDWRVYRVPARRRLEIRRSPQRD